MTWWVAFARTLVNQYTNVICCPVLYFACHPQGLVRWRRGAGEDGHGSDGADQDPHQGEREYMIDTKEVKHDISSQTKVSGCYDEEIKREFCRAEARIVGFCVPLNRH